MHDQTHTMLLYSETAKIISLDGDSTCVVIQQQSAARPLTPETEELLSLSRPPAVVLFAALALPVIRCKPQSLCSRSATVLINHS